MTPHIAPTDIAKKGIASLVHQTMDADEKTPNQRGWNDGPQLRLGVIAEEIEICSDRNPT